MLRITAAVLCLICSTSLHANSRMPRLRAAAPAAERLLERALRESAIVRDLASEIAASDLIVYVEIGPVDSSRSRATTELVAVTAYDRFVRVTLATLTPPPDLIPLLAHELQHAVEIAREPTARDSTSLRALYARIGTDAGSAHSFETAQARMVERHARRESLRRQR